jgi:hypothetical protein
MKNRTYRIFGLVLRVCFYKESGQKIKVYRNEYPYSNPTKEFQAFLFKVHKVGFWIFRSEKIYQDWASGN